MKKKSWYLAALLAILVAILIYLNRTVFNVAPEDIQTWILALGIFAPIVYVGLYALRPFILFPASILSLAGGLAFGPLYGTLLTVVGATAGAYLSFMLARKLGAERIEQKWGDKTQKIQGILEQNGFIVVFILRLVPLFSFDLISYSAGLSKIKTSHFMAATVIGMIPGTFAYTFLGASTVSDNKGTFILAVIIFAVVTIVPLLMRDQIKRFLSIQDKKS